MVCFGHLVMENDMFWSEIGSGFGESGGTPHHEFRGVPPPGNNMTTHSIHLQGIT